MSTAIRPSFYTKIPSLNDEPEVREGVSAEETALYTMSKSKGWKVFRELVRQVSEDLAQINEQAIMQGLPLAEIGQNTVVISMTRGVIDRLMNKVQDAVEACEKNEGDK